MTVRVGPIVVFGAAACTADPEVKAWHGAIEVTSVMRGDGDCDVALAPDEPDEPYLFIAVERGYPDVTTLYWCPEPKECGAPMDTSYLTALTETHLAGGLAIAEPFAGLCALRWNDVVADQDDAGHVSIVYRAGLEEDLDLGEAECMALVNTAIGSDCDAVLAIEGDRI